MDEPLFFATPADWRAWLEKNHTTATELSVGFYKKATGLPSITWQESVDEALCFGWIDGVRNSIDEKAYKIRFTPRRKGSMWSSVNLKRVAELTELGLMREAGLKIFEARDPNKTQLYSFENPTAQLSDAYQEQLEANPAAWTFFQSQAPSYQRVCLWWVMSAKQEATRQKRLTTLLEESAKGKKLAQFTSPAKPT